MYNDGQHFLSNQIYLQAQNITENAGDKQNVEQMGTTSTNKREF